MSQPPDYFPEDPGWRGKPKNEYYTNGRGRGCTTVVILSLIFGIFLLVVGGAALYIYDPTIIQSIFDLPNLPQTQQALDLTAQANRQQANDLFGTQMALGTREAGLNLSATQDALYAIATQTANAIENALTATQVQLDALRTQAALFGTATQSRLDLNASQTANANDIFATQSALDLVLTAARSAGDLAAAQTQQALDATTTQEAANANATASAAPLATPPANAQP